MKSNSEISSLPQRIIWSLDPSLKLAESKDLLRELRIWARHLNCAVQPVSVFSRSLMNPPLELGISMDEDFEGLAQKSFEAYLKKLGALDLLPAQLLFVAAMSKRQFALELSKYAEKTHALMIFARTQARKSWNPFRLGGFAETLTASARVPILLMNPHARASAKISSILFPTNFDANSLRALKCLEPIAKAFRAKVTIYNQLENPHYLQTEIGYFGQTQVLGIDYLLKEAKKIRQKRADMWSKLLQSKNLKSESIIKRARKSLSEDILNEAKRTDSQLIAIAAESGPISQAILGSHVRDLIIKAKCPVLVFYKTKVPRKQNLRTKHLLKQKGLTKTPATIQLN